MAETSQTEIASDPASGPSLRRPFKCLFVGGCPRSGTTLMQAILMQTGVVATAPETHLFPQYIERLYGAWDKFRAKKAAGHRDVGLHRVLSQADFEAALKAFSDQMLGTIAGRKGKPFVCEKTPENMLVWQEILRLYPKATMVHVVRDPRGVVASTKAARHWAAEWAQISVEQICHRWMRYVEAADACRASGAKLIEARYERLACGDAEYVASTLQQIGIRRTHKQAEEICAIVEIETMKQRVEKKGAFFHGEPEGFFRRGKPESWREELAAEETAVIESLTSDHMRRFGYVPAREA